MRWRRARRWSAPWAFNAVLDSAALAKVFGIATNTPGRDAGMLQIRLASTAPGAGEYHFARRGRSRRRQQYSATQYGASGTAPVRGEYRFSSTSFEYHFTRVRRQQTGRSRLRRKFARNTGPRNAISWSKNGKASRGL